MSPQLQIGPKLSEIINFSVVCNPETFILGTHGLPAGFRQINDCQSPVAKAKRPFRVNAISIRTAMDQKGTHPPHELLIDWSLRQEVKSAADSAHEEPYFPVLPVWKCVAPEPKQS
jgi:hypothetical protein